MTHDPSTPWTTVLTRRGALGAAIGTLASGLAAGSIASAQGGTANEAQTDESSEKIFAMFVQTAQAGSFRPKPGEEGVYQVVLQGASARTIYFSDRPHRLVGSYSTADFLAGLGFSAESPPNAAIITQTEDGNDDVIIVELLNPEWNPGSQLLTYDVIVLDEYTGDGFGELAQRQDDGELPETFGHTSVFIDDCQDLTVCVNEFDASDNGKWFEAPLPGGPVKQQPSPWIPCVPVEHDTDYYARLCSERYPINCPDMIFWYACDPR